MSTTDGTMTKAEQLRALYPGRQINIGLTITVMPLKVKQLRQFSESLTNLVPAVLNAVSSANPKTEAELTQVICATLVPLALKDLIALISDCVKDIDLDDVPQHLLPRIIDAWVEESFSGPGKLQPWIDLAKKLWAQVESTAIYGNLKKKFDEQRKQHEEARAKLRGAASMVNLTTPETLGAA